MAMTEATRATRKPRTLRVELRSLAPRRAHTCGSSWLRSACAVRA